MKFTHCIYQPGQHGIQTALSDPDAAGLRYAAYTAERLPDGTYGPNKEATAYLADLNAAHDPSTPPFQIMEWDEMKSLLRAAEDARFVHPWTEITEERYNYYLNVLPPCNWSRCDGVELFFVSEAMTSNIHTHCASHAGRFFTRDCRTSTPYTTLAAEVRALAAQVAA